MSRRLGHLLLALALLASQALGLSHAVHHGAPAAVAQAAGFDHGGHAPGSPLCQLLGHLGLADGAPCAPAPLPLQAAAADVAPVWLAAPQPARAALTAYAARAPPSAG